MNGVEGSLGPWGSSTQRWVFVSDNTSIKVKPSNIEPCTSSRLELSSAVVRSAVHFGYSDELINHRVFDLIWKEANNDGGIESFLDVTP